MKSKSKKINKPVRTAQIPAASAMLYEMEERLCHRMDQGVHEMKSGLHKLESGPQIYQMIVQKLQS